MGRPGFYNDNEYRSYPFVDRPTTFEALPYRLPDTAIVDAGFVMLLDAVYDDSTDVVYLQKVVLHDYGVFDFYFVTTTESGTHTIIFQRDFVNGIPESFTEYAICNNDNECAYEPVWSGFLVTGVLSDLIADMSAFLVEPDPASLPANVTIEGSSAVAHFAAGTYQIEPARIQNLNKGYLRSVTVANRERTKTPPCSDVFVAEDTTSSQIVVNAACLKGPIVFKEGYNTRITQVDRSSSLIFTAEKNSGTRADNELCENHSEIPLFPEEVDNKPLIHAGINGGEAKRSLFLSGGWACKDLIFTINGLGGSNVNIVSGKNIQIGYDAETNAITVGLSQNAQGQCNG
jgi:hypothetical protein